MFLEWPEGSKPLQIQSSQRMYAVFFHTPLCGTCKVARKMCTIVMETLPGVDIWACNVNIAQEEVQQFQIESVPCLMIARGDTVIEKLYAFSAVDKVYEFLLRHGMGNQRSSLS